MNLSFLLLALSVLLLLVGLLAAAAMRASRSKQPQTPTQQVQNPYRRFYDSQPATHKQHRGLK